MEDKVPDIQEVDRKQDHIDLAFQADMANIGPDNRFYYEPMMASHPSTGLNLGLTFLGKSLKAPLWISSMTGGTEKAFSINRRLATSCAKFGLGMGLGSCRPLLDSLDRLQDFNVREIIGADLPLYANLGIAQVEHLFDHDRQDDIQELLDRLQADGLILHINPLQEWLQPEGDFIANPPLDTLARLLDHFSFPVVVKEVGQGMGPQSIEALMKMPIAALELAAHGGTNFSKLELLRSTGLQQEIFEPVSGIGHSIAEMISFINDTVERNGDDIKCREFILSGGIRNFLDGYYWMKKINASAIYGQASGFLKYANESQEALDNYILSQIEGLQLAKTYLKVK
jgi:isopentenyl-diphosphate delta-isomerase